MSLNAIVPVVGSMTRQRRSRFRMSIDGGFHFRNSWLFYHHVFLALLFSLCLRLFFFFFLKKKNLRVFFFVFSCEVNSVLFFCHFTCFNLSVVQSPSFVFFFFVVLHIFFSFTRPHYLRLFFFLIAALSFTYKRVSRACLFAITFFFSSLHFCIYIYILFFLSFFSPVLECVRGA